MKINSHDKEVLKLCICENCPTYIDCSKKGGKKEKGFCFLALEKDRCIKQQKGCICGACLIKQKKGLKNFYFCILGSEEQQNKKKQ